MKFNGGRNMVIGKQHKIRDKQTKEDNSLTKDRDIDIDRTKDRSLQVLSEDNLIPRSYNYNKLKLRSIPFFFWLIGLSFISAGLILSYNIIVGEHSEKRIMNAFFGESAWEYLILGFIFIIGISMFVTARYESVTLDKSNNEVILSKFFLFRCKSKKLRIPLSQINSIYPVTARGDSNASDSSIYKIGIRFNKTDIAMIFKSVFKRFIINDIITLRSYVFGHRDTYASVQNELRPRLSVLSN